MTVSDLLTGRKADVVKKGFLASNTASAFRPDDMSVGQGYPVSGHMEGTGSFVLTLSPARVTPRYRMSVGCPAAAMEGRC